MSGVICRVIAEVKEKVYERPAVLFGDVDIDQKAGGSNADGS